MIYKLLHDSLLILMTFFVLTLIAEGVLPGIISNHFGLYKITIVILLNILAILGIKKNADLPAENSINKKIAWPLLFILALLIFNSLLKLNIFLILTILTAILASGYFIFKVFQEEY